MSIQLLQEYKKKCSLRSSVFGLRRLGLFALFWFSAITIGPLGGLASKADAQAATQGSVLFDSCFVKGARVPAGINYTVNVTVTVNHPAFADPATTANLIVSHGTNPKIVISNQLLQTNGGSRVGGTATPAGPPTVVNPTFPLNVEVVINNPALGINNVSLTLSGGSRARIVPATIDSPFMAGGTDWVKITGQGNVDDLGVETPFKPTRPSNDTGDFVEEFQVTDWVYGMTNKPFRVKTFQGSRPTPVLDRNYQLESGFRRHTKPLSTYQFNFMPPNMWGTSFNSKFFKGTTPSHTTTSLPFYW